ncbi:unnamed protein product [Pylaiella littoralis]
MRSRPVSAGKSLSTAPPTSAHPKSRIEQALLHKIGLLADHHAKNVQALHALRSTSTPPTAWAGVADPPPPYESVSPGQTRKRVPNDEYKMNDGRSTCQPPSRVFTRVVTCSNRSPLRNKPTVVEPFPGMETHATAWKRKMRQYEELDFQAKRDEEESKCRDRERFIAAINSVGEFSGVIARSNEMMERRRQKMIEAEEKEEEVRRSHEFKAMPLHIADEDWQTIQNRQTVRRNQRIQMRKELMSSISHLPRRMAMHALTRKAAAADTADTADRREKTKIKVRPRRRSVSPEQIREVLSRRQRLWDQKLLSAKRKKKPVVPQVLPMEEREKVYRQRAQERAQERAKRENDKSSWASQALEEATKRRIEKETSSAQTPVIPRTTQKCLMKTAQVQARRKQERYDIEREEREEKTRHARQQEVGRALAEVIKRIDRQQGRLARRQIDKEVRKKAREDHERYRRALKDNQIKLEQATHDAPTLWERHDAEVRKEEAKRIALSTIADRVFGAASTSADKKNWRGRAAEKIFDEEERAVISLSSY